MQWFLREMLECPACHGALTWTVTDVRANQIEEGAARCMSCYAVYPVREGIGLFLTPDLPRDDLWEAAASGLARHLSEHPEVERQLLDVPLAALAPADQFFRALVLEERGAFKDAQAQGQPQSPQGRPQTGGTPSHHRPTAGQHVASIDQPTGENQVRRGD